MTQTAYVFTGFGGQTPRAVYFSLDRLVVDMQRKYPGHEIEVKSQTVKIRRGGTYTRHYIQVSGIREHVQHLGEFTGFQTFDFVTVPVADPENWSPA